MKSSERPRQEPNFPETTPSRRSFVKYGLAAWISATLFGRAMTATPTARKQDQDVSIEETNMTFHKPQSASPWIPGFLIGVIAIFHLAPLHAAEAPTIIAPPVLDAPKAAAGTLQTAVFAGGCFWGVQGVFEHVRGVRKVVSGYAGGDAAGAQYEIVSSGATGHAESVRITFDPAQVSYGKLLQIFFSVAHDPTQINRQGPDIGAQYRSAIFYADKSQKVVAGAYVAQLNGTHAFPRKIVTRVDPLKGFYPAEAYHQDFLIRNPRYPYIVFNDLPKIENLKHLFPDDYRENPVTVGDSVAP